MNGYPPPLVLEHWRNRNWGTLTRRAVKLQISSEGVYQLRVEHGQNARTLDYRDEPDANNALGLLLTEHGPWTRLARAPGVRRYTVTLTRAVDADGLAAQEPRPGSELHVITYTHDRVPAETPADAARLVAEQIRAGELDDIIVGGAHVPVPEYLPGGFASCRVSEHPEPGDGGAPATRSGESDRGADPAAP